MKVTAKIKLDLRSQNYGSSVYAVQGDGGSRCVEAALLDGGKPWNVPAGVTAAVAYKKPDFTKGLYDKLADDTPAVTVSGSTITVVLAKQMLTVPGSVQACIVFNNAALDQLTTFPFTVAVAANPVIGAEPSDDYIRLQWLEYKLDEYVKKITEGIVPGGSGGAVSSVNGKTGAVVLTADDVHALPDNTVIPTVPEKVSAFENDAGYLTEHQDISGKVDKVAGKGLSTHDYDDAAKAKVDAIPEDPKYTDTEYDDTAVVESLNQLKNDISKLSESKMPIVFSEIANIEITESGVSLISLQSGDHYIQEKYTTFFLKMITPANIDATGDMVPMLYFSINNKINYDDYGYYSIFGCSNGAFSIQRGYEVYSVIQFVIVGNTVSSVATKNGYGAPSYGFQTISSVGFNLNGRGRADITGVILNIRNNGEYPYFPIGTKISLYAR